MDAKVKGDAKEKETYRQKIQRIIDESPILSLRLFRTQLPSSVMWSEDHFLTALDRMCKFAKDASIGGRVFAVYSELEGDNKTNFMRAVIKEVSDCQDALPMNDGSLQASLIELLYSFERTRRVRIALELMWALDFSPSVSVPFPLGTIQE